MKTIENVSCLKVMGQSEFIIELFDKDTLESILIKIPAGQYDKSSIINILIREKYRQDQVEAIINNHFLNIADWLDKKFKGEEIAFEDSEYEDFQTWRAECKTYAEMILEAIKEFI